MPVMSKMNLITVDFWTYLIFTVICITMVWRPVRQLGVKDKECSELISSPLFVMFPLFSEFLEGFAPSTTREHK